MFFNAYETEQAVAETVETEHPELNLLVNFGLGFLAGKLLKKAASK